MADFTKDIKREMIRNWKTTFKSSLQPFEYKRELEATTVNPDNDPSAPQPYYDPVTETWIYPTGVAENSSYALTGLVRLSEKEAMKDPDILVSDYKITLLYDTLQDLLTTDPYTSDTVVYQGSEYRIVKAKTDSVKCFWNIFVRGI